MTPTGIDHLVLTVQDLDETSAFYRDVLGAEIVTFGDDRTALRFGDQKINVHPVENDVDLVADRPTPGAGDFCLLTDDEIEAVIEDVESAGVDIIAGPVEREGARGPMTSVYLRDPDDNLVEVATYGG